MNFLKTRQAAELWGISPRRVAILCAQGRIPDVVKIGKTWFLPPDAEKPTDPRTIQKDINTTEERDAQ